MGEDLRPIFLKNVSVCLEPMGIDNSLMVHDNQLKASSELDKPSGAAAARLYNEFGGWSPR
jgi:hypothetical protein